MNRTYRLGGFGLVLSVLLIGACTTPNGVAPKGPRPPTTAESVKIYTLKPQRYELLGTVVVPVTPEISWDDRGNANLGFDRLKAQAAALGANGLLLIVSDGSANATTVAGYHGTFYTVPVRSQPKAAVAEAIYVLKE